MRHDETGDGFDGWLYLFQDIPVQHMDNDATLTGFTPEAVSTAHGVTCMLHPWLEVASQKRARAPTARAFARATDTDSCRPTIQMNAFFEMVERADLSALCFGGSQTSPPGSGSHHL
jgi:hypothetical protein